MILIVGLGNPGKKYSETRHNLGFMVVDGLLKKLTSVKDSSWTLEKKFNTELAKVKDDILLAKPLSFMNSSGEVVSKIMNFYKIPLKNLYLIHDDVDLPIGKIKITVGHGSAGHKGVESIIQKTGGIDFTRIRVGIGGDHKVDAEDFVLSPFSREESGKLNHAIKRAVEAALAILKDGVEKASTRFNQ